MNDQIKSDQIEKQTLTKQIRTDQIEKQALNKQIIKLEKALEQKENIISIHKTVIRLFDDSDHTLQNAIQDQLDNQQPDTSG
ncbi:MAG: hypothetical protein HUK40_16215 [Desulfobacter sp.]|nr:hypothetical protein [Desulfobacter sp.]WDP87092.1 MAG: hypothetical protein HUN05_19790 [Desulfobacter sp.]